MSDIKYAALEAYILSKAVPRVLVMFDLEMPENEIRTELLKESVPPRLILRCHPAAEFSTILYSVQVKEWKSGPLLMLLMLQEDKAKELANQMAKYCTVTDNTKPDESKPHTEVF